jgi:hypothetical protein
MAPPNSNEFHHDNESISKIISEVEEITTDWEDHSSVQEKGIEDEKDGKMNKDIQFSLNVAMAFLEEISIGSKKR